MQKKMMFYPISICLASLVLGVPHAIASHNGMYHETPSLYGTMHHNIQKYAHRKTRNNATWQSSYEIQCSCGSTRTAWNNDKQKVNILNIAGPINILYLAQNAPQSPEYNHWFNLTPALQNGRSIGTFGQLEPSGKHSFTQAHISFHHYLGRRLFVEGSIACKHAKIYNISLKDLTPETGNMGYNQLLAHWQVFKAQLDPILASYGIKPLTSTWSKTGLSDATLALGINTHIWKKNNFYATSVCKGGVLLPTSESKQTDHAYALALGNNRHLGLNAYAQLTFGFSDQYAIRLHAGGTYFIKGDSEKMYSMKSDAQQSGLLMLAHRAHERLGLRWHAGTDLTLNALLKGVSLTVGYSCTRQENTKLTPATPTLYDQAVINSDLRLKAWEAHIIHTALECNTSPYLKNKTIIPRVKAFINIPFSGKNIYNITTYAGAWGVDVHWNF